MEKTSSRVIFEGAYVLLSLQIAVHGVRVAVFAHHVKFGTRQNPPHKTSVCFQFKLLHLPFTTLLIAFIGQSIPHIIPKASR
jgi:hypothetical protein